MLAKKGATYQNVYFDSDGEAGKFTANIFAYPTTYVIDRNGNIVGEPIVGAITEKEAGGDAAKAHRSGPCRRYGLRIFWLHPLERKSPWHEKAWRFYGIRRADQTYTNNKTERARTESVRALSLSSIFLLSLYYMK